MVPIHAFSAWYLQLLMVNLIVCTLGYIGLVLSLLLNVCAMFIFMFLGCSCLFQEVNKRVMGDLPQLRNSAEGIISLS